MAPRPKCRWCNRVFKDQVCGCIECLRAHEKGAQCTDCLRVFSNESDLKVANEAEKAKLEYHNQTDEGAATWAEKMQKHQKKGKNGREGIGKGAVEAEDADADGDRGSERVPMRAKRSW